MKTVISNLGKFKWYLLGLIGALVIILIGMAVVGGQAQVSDGPAPETIEQALQNIDPNYRKDTGMLPNSAFYFLKSWKEGIAKTFKSGEAKKTYIAKLSQKRLVEAWLMIELKDEKGEKTALNKYNGLIQTMSSGDYTNLETEIAKSYNLIGAIQSYLPENDLYKQATEKTWKLIEKNIPVTEKKQAETIVQGEIKEINDLGYIVDWNGNLVPIGNLEDVIFVNKDGEKTNQTKENIKVGTIIALVPVDGVMNIVIGGLK